MSKLRLIALVCISLWVVSAGCATHRYSQPIAYSTGAIFRPQGHKVSPTRFTTFVYGQNKHSVHVTFTLIEAQAGTAHWEMQVGAPFKYLPTKDHDQVGMEPSISVVSEKAYLILLNGSLTSFCHLYPSAQIDDMVMGSEIVQPLWEETLSAMRAGLSREPGTKISMHDPMNDNLNEPPVVSWTVPNEVLQRSETVAATRHIFLRHGFQIHTVHLADEFWFQGVAKRAHLV